MKTLTITIKAGKVTADYSGFLGKSCVALDDRIRPEGVVIEEQELKPEHSFVSAAELQVAEESKW